MQQKAKKSEKPLLIRIERNAGHGYKKPLGKIIEELKDVYTFIAKSLKLNYKE